MDFEWHETKSKSNLNEAMSCFKDPNQLAFFDPDHSEDEEREIMIAHSSQGRVLLVVYTVRCQVIRIISARLATKREMNDYAKRI